MAPAGYMEQLNQLLFSFEAFAKGDDGVVVPFSLRVSQPAYETGHGYYCIVDCPIIREKPFKIFGAHEEQACELSIVFIRQSVEDQKVHLVDAKGQDVTILAIPPDTILPVASSETDDP